MSRQTDYLRWVMQCGKERRYAGEDYFWAVLESAIADVDERMMELPLDADEVPIRVGDVMRHVSGECYEVLGVGEGEFFTRVDCPKGYARFSGESFTHKKRELEDVLKDFLDRAFAAQDMFVAESMDSDEYDSTLEELARKTAEEIRGMM